MAKILVFIENKIEINAIEKYDLKHAVIIAMNPSVGLELVRRGMSFEDTKSLFGVDGHRHTLKHAKLIVEGLRPFLNKINANGIQHAFEKTWIVYFRIHLYYLLTSLFIVNSAVQKYSPSKLIIVRDKNDNNSFGQIVEEYASSNGINFQNASKETSNKTSVKKESLLIKFITKLIFQFQLRLFSIIVNNRDTFLVLSDSNNMPRFVNKLSNHFTKSFPVYLSVQRKTLKIRMIEMCKGQTFSFLSIPKYTPGSLIVNFHQKYNNCAKEIKGWLYDSNPYSRSYGVDLGIHIMDYIEVDLKKKMVALCGEIISLNKLLAKVRPKSVFAQHNLGIGYALGEICLKENIPGLLITHGSHTPQKNSFPDYEWGIHAHQIFNGMYPFVAIQTPWAKSFLNKQIGVVSRAIETGPLILVKPNNNVYSKFELRCRLFGKKHAQKQIILHASSPKGWKFYRPWIYETLDEYIYNINTLIRASEKLPGLYLCIRFRPEEDLSLKEFKMSLVTSDCYGVYSDGSIEEFLMSSDLLISYSSTTIEEALQYHLPVMQFDSDGKYEHLKGKKLPIDGINSFSTVYSVLDENHLLPALEWWKENHSDDINRKLDWTEHVFENKDDMEWLEIMDIKC